ncbi:MAG: 2TM domain-containing protein [Anaerolineae bacterium]|nr:2TM domain-containing protein [Anaerolineae bacterium]
MSDQSLNYDAIRYRADQRIRKRLEFYKHLGVYMLVNLFVWLFFGFIFISTPSHNLAVMIPAVLTTIGWGMAVAIHGLVNYLDTVNTDAMRDREIQREIAREIAMRGMDVQDLFEKPKRDRLVRLSDDGELVTDEGESQRQARARRG